MEILLEEDSNPDDLTKRHVENKTLLDQALKSGHILLDELQNGESAIRNNFIKLLAYLLLTILCRSQ